MSRTAGGSRTPGEVGVSAPSPCPALRAGSPLRRVPGAGMVPVAPGWSPLRDREDRDSEAPEQMALQAGQDRQGRTGREGQAGAAGQPAGAVAPVAGSPEVTAWDRVPAAAGAAGFGRSCQTGE